MNIDKIKEAAKKYHKFIAFDINGKQIPGSVGSYPEYEKQTVKKVVSEKSRDVSVNGVLNELKIKNEELWFFIPVDMLIEKENLRIIEGKKITEQVIQINLSSYGFDVEDIGNSEQRYKCSLRRAMPL